MDGLEEKEDLKIKDLLIKLQILAQGLIEERKKSSNYLEKIKNFEQIIQEKDQSITDLNKEKFDLQAKLSLERSKNGPKKKSGKIGNFVGNFFSDNQNNGKITQLEQETNKLKYEKKNLLQSLAEDKEKFEQEQMKLQTSIALQATKITQLEKEKEDLREEIRNLAMQRENVKKMIQDFEDNKYKYDEQYKKFKLENDIKSSAGHLDSGSTGAADLHHVEFVHDLNEAGDLLRGAGNFDYHAFRGQVNYAASVDVDDGHCSLAVLAFGVDLEKKQFAVESVLAGGEYFLYQFDLFDLGQHLIHGGIGSCNDDGDTGQSRIIGR